MADEHDRTADGGEIVTQGGGVAGQALQGRREDVHPVTAIQQPALIAASLASLAALRSRGIVPDYVVGHSVGEFAALQASDAYTLEEAFALVRARGLAMAAAALEFPGSMAAILGLEDEVVETLCRQILGVWPANYNCPGQIVVSGENNASGGYQEAMQEVEFGKMTAQTALNSVQQQAIAYVAKAKQENPDWYAAGD